MIQCCLQLAAPTHAPTAYCRNSLSFLSQFNSLIQQQTDKLVGLSHSEHHILRCVSCDLHPNVTHSKVTSNTGQ